MAIKYARVFSDLPILPGVALDGIDADFWRGLEARYRRLWHGKRMAEHFTDRTAGWRIARLDGRLCTMYIHLIG